MATLSRADIAAVLNLVFADQMYDQFRRDAIIPNLLEVKEDGNSTCTWRVKFDGRTAGGAFTEGADMSDGDFESHERAQASLSWAQYREGVKVSGLALAISRANGAGPMGGNLFMEEVNDAIDNLAVVISEDCYGGNPSASPVELAGAALAIDDAAGTFAGLASSTYGDWLAIEDTCTVAALSKQKIRELLLTPVKQSCGHRVEVVTVPDDLWDNIVALADEGATDVKEVRINGKMVDVVALTGVTAVFIDGVPFINDRHATAGVLYAWNFRFVKFHQVPVNPGIEVGKLVAAVKALTGVDIEPEEVERRLRAMSSRLQPTVEILAQTGDAYKAQVKAYIQLEWSRRNAFGKLVVT